MFADLNVLSLASAMAAHAGARQAVIARNMANSDTPGYRAQDIAPFAEVAAATAAETGLRATRPGHLGGGAGQVGHWATFAAESAPDPNGNTVSIEREMLNAVEVKRQHDQALAIYRSALGILRAGLGKV